MDPRQSSRGSAAPAPLPSVPLRARASAADGHGFRGRAGPGGDSVDRRARWPVVLVSMPFVDAHRPSIQLGLLKAITAAHGFPVRTYHAYLDFAARIGVDRYQVLVEQRDCMVGDWLFSVEAFGELAPDPGGELLRDFAGKLSSLGTPLDELLAIRRRTVPAYLEELAMASIWDGVRVVGFSSTFQQNAASFALARRLKERYPGITTVFGGANFDGEMGVELVRAVDSIDAAVVGEGDTAFPELLCGLADGLPPDRVPGVVCRVDGEARLAAPRQPTLQLDDLPVPDYDEYFRHAHELGLLSAGSRRKTWIPVETARGCWWGAKHHCTFCGLNGTTMQFRAKSPERVLAELATQARRYHSFRFEAVDNILDMRYLNGLFPHLVTDDGANYEMFYEVKANLSRDQLRVLRRAGVTHIQPGLESLSTRVLRLMRKGANAAQNVNLLRWSRHYGIRVSWNLLWGFPGETEEDYAEQAAVLSHLVHLPPPSSAGRLWLERFSPLYTERDTFPLRSRAPVAGYRYVYPETVDLSKVAYFFDYEVDGALPEEAYADVTRGVQDWCQAWSGDRQPVLTYWSAPHVVQIYDGRHPGREGTYTFEGALADVYLACTSRPVTATAVRNRVSPDLPVRNVEEMLGELASCGLVFLDGPLALALALPAVTER